MRRTDRARPRSRIQTAERGQPPAALSAGERDMIERLAVAKDRLNEVPWSMHCRGSFDSASLGSSMVAVDALHEVLRASARRIGLRAYPTRFGSCRRCAWQPGY